MTGLEHLNAGWIQVPGGPRASCHCLLLRDAAGAALVDTGIGLMDVRDTDGRIGRELVESVGFQFDESDTAVRQLARRGIRAEDVKHIVLTHLDPDHAGGLADFPAATVHLSLEELGAWQRGDPRYRPGQFTHGPRWRAYGPGGDEWLGLEARRVALEFSSPVFLVPLFGHTAGHCGVAVRQAGRWAFHVGDAYYLRAELADPAHPVGGLAAARAADNAGRLRSLERLRQLAHAHGATVDFFGCHDVEELSRDEGGRADFYR